MLRTVTMAVAGATPRAGQMGQSPQGPEMHLRKERRREGGRREQEGERERRFWLEPWFAGRTQAVTCESEDENAFMAFPLRKSGGFPLSPISTQPGSGKQKAASS